MRSMHYYDVTGQTFPEGHMRLTPHTDITFITLLFHWPGETGLEVTTAISIGSLRAPANLHACPAGGDCAFGML